MSYEPTTWANGDIITATKLNNIESGVQSVSSSYTPTTWVNGDIITATKLNNIEQGIANASGGGGGSSDFSTAEVTIIANSGSGAVGLTGGISGYSEGFAFIRNGDPKMLVSFFGVQAGASGTAQALLVEGYAEYELEMGMNVSVTGDCTYDDEEGVFAITGDCTITADPTT